MGIGPLESVIIMRGALPDLGEGSGFGSGDYAYGDGYSSGFGYGDGDYGYGYISGGGYGDGYGEDVVTP